MTTYGLLFFLSEDYTESDVNRLREVISELANTGQWILAPPEFIDDIEEPQSDSSHPEDEAIRTVGGFLVLHPPSRPPNGDIEKAHLHEVERIIEAVTKFSKETGCELEVELGGCMVGEIKNGVPDNLIMTGLLNEWRKSF